MCRFFFMTLRLSFRVKIIHGHGFLPRLSIEMSTFAPGRPSTQPPCTATLHMNDFISWCRRYLSFTLLGALAVLSIVLFFNENSLVSTIGQEQRIDELQTLILDAQDTLELYRGLNRSLDTSRETLERIVREQHHMQHPDEDVYLLE